MKLKEVKGIMTDRDINAMSGEILAVLIDGEVITPKTTKFSAGAIEAMKVIHIGRNTVTVNEESWRA